MKARALGIRPFHLIVLLLSAGLPACSGCGGDDPIAGADSGDGGPPAGDAEGGDDAAPADLGAMDALSRDTDSGTPAPDGGADAQISDGGGALDAADPMNLNNPRNDTDCDGLSDAEEFSTLYPGGGRTDPNVADTDGDGILDGLELARTSSVAGSGCPPLAGDADPTSRTSPLLADTDGDGIPDGVEDVDRNGRLDPNESNPLLTDSDGDGITDAVEDANRNGLRDPGELNPASRDSDGDLIGDGVEDANRNGTRDAGETDPLSQDTDADGLTDGGEDQNHNGVRETYETDPRTSDTDCDGIADGAEYTLGTSPIVPDTDGDGISDGVEVGVTQPIAGSGCPATMPIDLDPTTTTLPLDIDSDNDGIPDGVEDSNRDGRRDSGELDPNDSDTDGDGLSDGDEVLSGFDPNDPMSPNQNAGGGIQTICADTNLKVVDFNVGGQNTWTLSTEQSFVYTPITVSAAGAAVDVGAFDDATNGVSGFVLRMPIFAASPVTSAAQTTALFARMGGGAALENLSIVTRTSPRNITSHDGFETAVSGVVDIGVTAGTQNAAQLRNALVRLSTGLSAGDFTGLPQANGPSAAAWVYGLQVLVRGQPQELIVVGALLERNAFDSATANSSILVSDLTNGTALALANARRDKDCDPFTAQGESVADFIWMADISGSTDDDRGRIVSASGVVFNTLAANNVDFRMGVVPHNENDFNQGNGNGGDLRGVGFTRDPNLFATYLQDTTGTNGCEFGLDAVRAAIAKALPRSAPGAEEARKVRDNAILAIVYISDEFAQEVQEQECGYNPGGTLCDTGILDVYRNNENVCLVTPNATQQACIDQIVQPYIAQIQQNSAIAFAQVISPSATPVTCSGYACPQPGSQAVNEQGLGYVEVVNATGGTFYSPCVDNPGAALQSIVDAVSGAASQYQLTGAPISSTIKVGVTRIGVGGTGITDIVPRDKDDGFDYDPVSNAIFFRGFNYRPNLGDLVIISYRVWAPPEEPCGGPCPQGQICNPQTGVCSCDQALCTTGCGPRQVCDASCQCVCAPDCNGQCGSGQVCNTAACTCECAPNCGGACPQGTVCNQAACACECDASCGGACAGTLLTCDQASCTCQCPASCGGRCAGNTICNASTCDCVCSPTCSASCPGNATCDPASDCACVCPPGCGGGCPDNTLCNPTSCACECPADCTTVQGCINRQTCDPANGCQCYCPPNCGGCASNETCDVSSCRCVPIV